MKMIIGLFKFFAVMFVFLVVADGMARTIFFSPDILKDEYKIVRGYQSENFIILNSFSYEVKAKNKALVMSYTLFPNTLKLPSILTITNINGEVSKREDENILLIIMSLLYLFFGSYVLYKFIQKYGSDFRIGYDGSN
jgi:hypothetical protein